MKRPLALAALAVAALVGLAVAFAPYLYAEVLMACGHIGCRPMPAPAHPEAFAARPGPAAGRVVDGWWRVQQIGPDTWAIGEPARDPDNYEYLLVGRERALLFDAGLDRTHDIHRPVAELTRLPVTVIPSHLHFDHTNGLAFFRSGIALVDLPETRSRAPDGTMRLSRYQYEGWSPGRFAVSRWVKPGETIDLGGRTITVLSTPGHTTNSVSLWDPARRWLFTGDLLYPTTLYAFGPDSSLSTYVKTLDRLTATLPPDTRIWGAHCCRNDGSAQAPWLDMGDVRDARNAIAAVEAGTAKGRGHFIRRFPVNARITLLTLYPWANR